MRLTLPLLALLLLTPLAAAQEPVSVLCGALAERAPEARDQVPLCPGEPPAPAAPQAAAPAAAAAEADAPAEAQALAERAVEDAQGIAEDPASAPERLAGLLAAIVAFVERLLELPVEGGLALGAQLQAGGDAIEAGVARAAGSIGDALARAGEHVASIGQAAVDALRGLIATPQALSPHPTQALAQAPAQALELQLPLDELRQVLPEG